MIKRINHTFFNQAKTIYEIFQASYAVEAKILNHPDFPPLKRTIKDIQNSQTQFYAYQWESQTCAVMELDTGMNHIHINSLTVAPKFFRRGIGFKLLNFIYDEFAPHSLSVETGHANTPAVKFYLNFGFEKNKVWMTDAGIEKISFTLIKKSKKTNGNENRCH
jgi:ribosomal protein S18 acetylase RimI-like enzyme